MEIDTRIFKRIKQESHDRKCKAISLAADVKKNKKMIKLAKRIEKDRKDFAIQKASFIDMGYENMKLKNELAILKLSLEIRDDIIIELRSHKEGEQNG